MAWQVLVPIKALEDAKSRLDGDDAGRRPQLALAFATDALTAAIGCAQVEHVYVVTSDPRVREVADTLGATCLPDSGAGLNTAISQSAEQLEPANIAALVGDLPALSSADLHEALELAASFDRAFVCDAAGVGTTLLTAAAGTRLDPSFGGHSRAAHAASGAMEIRAFLPRLRRDVDTEVDLWDAVRLGVGTATWRVIGSRT